MAVDWKLELVLIPVTDVDRAKYFYSEQAGFAVDHDTPGADGARIVQLTPPGSGCSIAIGTGIIATPPGSAQGMQLVVTDIDSARTELTERGVEVSPIQHFDGQGMVEGRGEDWNAFVFFSDPDGNGWVVQETPVRD